MVVKIIKPKPSMASVIDYNEKKVLSGAASVIGYANLPDCDMDTVERTFSNLENGARYPISEVSFHASINPSPDDRCTQEDILRLATEMMVRGGYAAQPFIVYRHNDIDREHYHIISIRIDSRGKKIGNYYEGEKLNRFLLSVQDRYRFSLGKGDSEEQERKATETPGRIRVKISRYNPRQGMTSQLKDIFYGALKYDFNGFTQLAFILKEYGIEACQRSNDSGEYITLQPLDRRDRPAGPVVSEFMLGERLSEQMNLASALNSRNHANRHREKERMENLVRGAFLYSKSEAHFEALLRNKGISVHLSRTEDGDVFGITLVDHVTHTVFKSSELHDCISVAMMKEAVETCKWRAEDRGERKRVTYVARTRKSSRREAIAMRDRQIAVMASVLRPEASDWAAYSGKGENETEPHEKPTTEGRIVDDIMGGMRIRLD